MKSRVRLNGPVAVLLALLCVGGATCSAQTLSNSFDASGDLSAFKQANSGNASATTATGLQQASGIGTGGTGGVRFVPSTGQTDLTAISTTAFSFAGGGGYAFSMDFRKQANIGSGGAVFQQGFSSSASAALGWPGTDMLSFRLVQAGTNTAQFVLANRAAGDASTTYTNIGSAFAFDASSTDWFHLAVSLTLTDPAASLFSYTVSLYDIGSNGTGSLGAALGTVTGTCTNAALAGDASAYFGFRYGSAAASAVDNLSVAPVPEPRSAALLLGGLALAAIGGRAWHRRAA